MFEVIIKKIENREYNAAEEDLKGLLCSCELSEKDTAQANYWIGYINTCLNSYGDKEYGKNCLLKCLNSKFAVPWAYILYVRAEKNYDMAIKYIKKGMEKFPENLELLKSYLKTATGEEQKKAFALAANPKYIDKEYNIFIINFLIEREEWIECNVFVDRILLNNKVNEYEEAYLSLVKGFSYVMHDYELAIDFFIKAKEFDYSNKFRYAPHIGLLYSYAKAKDLEAVIRLLNEIPVTNVVGDLEGGPDNIISIDFEKIYRMIFAEAEKLVHPKRELKLKIASLRTLYLYSAYEEYGVTRFNKKDILSVENYEKVNSSKNLKGRICQMHMGVNDLKRAVDLYMESFADDNQELTNISFLEILDDMNEDDLTHTVKKIVNEIRENRISFSQIFIVEILEVIIDRLWESDFKNKYSLIYQLTKACGTEIIFKIDKKFECAYSSKQCKDSEIAKAIYMYELECEPDNTSVLNNLGIIFEEENLLEEALEFLDRAAVLVSDDKKITENRDRIKSRLGQALKVIGLLEKENIWNISRLNRLISEVDKNGEFDCTYKNRSILLHVSPTKGDELFNNYLEKGYIEKISNGDFNKAARYKFNHLVIDHIEKKLEYISKNREYEDIGFLLNYDNLESIGYTESLQNKIAQMPDISFRDLLQRDFKECAIAYLSRQYKTTIILCGSIVEAIITYTLSDKNIIKYDIGLLLNKRSKYKKIIDMDLNELLEVAKVEGIIQAEQYHLIHYLRFYRNIIHPSVEIRKSYNINEEKGTMMWNTLKIVLNEVL